MEAWPRVLEEDCLVADLACYSLGGVVGFYMGSGFGGYTRGLWWHPCSIMIPTLDFGKSNWEAALL